MAKRKVTVMIDEDILDSLSDLGADNVSSIMNDALRSWLDALVRNQALGELLDSWREQYGDLSEAERAEAKATFDELDGFVAKKVA